MSDKQEPTEELSSLVNKGRFKEAKQLAARYANQVGLSLIYSPHFWFQYALDTKSADAKVTETDSVGDEALSDKSRKAILAMLEARIEYAERHYWYAYMLHQDAHELWLSLGEDANQQWVLDNLFYWLKASTAEDYESFPHYPQILHDPRRSRRVRAQLIHHFRKVGLWFDQLLERLYR